MGRQCAKAGAKQKFFDFGVDGEGADERHGVAKRKHPNRLLIFVRVELGPPCAESGKDSDYNTSGKKETLKASHQTKGRTKLRP